MEVVEKLTSLSGEEALKTPGTPQNRAAHWIADFDPIPNLSRTRSSGTGLDLDDPRFEQRYVMALFYYAMDGVNCNQNAKWLSSESECYWFGIDGASEGCGGVQEDMNGFQVNAGGCVVKSNADDYDKVCRISMGK